MQRLPSWDSGKTNLDHTFHSYPFILFLNIWLIGSHITQQAPSPEVSQWGAYLGLLDEDTRDKYSLRTLYPPIFLRTLQEQPRPTLFSTKRMHWASTFMTMIRWSSLSNTTSMISGTIYRPMKLSQYPVLGCFLEATTKFGQHTKFHRLTDRIIGGTYTDNWPSFLENHLLWGNWLQNYRRQLPHRGCCIILQYHPRVYDHQHPGGGCVHPLFNLEISASRW